MKNFRFNISKEDGKAYMKGFRESIEKKVTEAKKADKPKSNSQKLTHIDRLMQLQTFSIVKGINLHGCTIEEIIKLHSLVTKDESGFTWTNDEIEFKDGLLNRSKKVVGKFSDI